MILTLIAHSFRFVKSGDTRTDETGGSSPTSPKLLRVFSAALFLTGAVPVAESECPSETSGVSASPAAFRGDATFFCLGLVSCMRPTTFGARLRGSASEPSALGTRESGTRSTRLLSLAALSAATRLRPFRVGPAGSVWPRGISSVLLAAAAAPDEGPAAAFAPLAVFGTAVEVPPLGTPCSAPALAKRGLFLGLSNIGDCPVSEGFRREETGSRTRSFVTSPGSFAPSSLPTDCPLTRSAPSP